jgi:hypothetical protein
MKLVYTLNQKGISELLGYPDSAHYPRTPYRIRAGVIRVRYASDTPTGVSEYPDNSDTPRYASDTSMIFFFKIFWWIRSKIRSRYSSICHDTSPSEIYIRSFVLL